MCQTKSLLLVQNAENVSRADLLDVMDIEYVAGKRAECKNVTIILDRPIEWVAYNVRSLQYGLLFSFRKTLIVKTNLSGFVTFRAGILSYSDKIAPQWIGIFISPIQSLLDNKHIQA